MSGVRPADNPFNAQRVDRLAYIDHDHALTAVAAHLKQRNYRGALCAPHGHGKSALLRALGEHLMEHGLAPLPLFMNADERGRLPRTWRRTVAAARPTDALLLDGYDLLPAWARLWVVFRSRRAGALIVTTHRDGYLPTVARPESSPALLRRLIDELSPTGCETLDVEKLYHESNGNLRDALERAYHWYAQKNQASDAAKSRKAS